MNIIGLDKTKVRTSSETAEFTLGTVGRVDGSGKLYKYVKFNNGAGDVASVVGNFCYYYAVSGASAGQYTEVTMDLTDSGGIGAGVFQSIIADGGYGWIQIKGQATLAQTIEDTPVDGGPLTAIGVAIDASAKIVFLDCPW